MSDPKIRVMIVDDHTMVRSSLALFLNSTDRFELVGEAANGREAVLRQAVLNPDIILMDLMMPEMNGVEAMRAILATHPDVRIIALTSFKEDNLVHDALQAGAMSYLLKNASLTELMTAIEGAYAGHPTLAPEVTQVLIHAARRPEPRPEQLTPREREILSLMVDGQTNRQIAQHLALGLSTVKFHVSSILSKLNASSRTEAVAMALQHQLIS